jgi:FkbM family methyltransferase
MTMDHDRPSKPEYARLAPGDVGKERRAGVALVSVVIPCYNQAHFLGEAIESVLTQSHPRFEIVVVDDGSTDNTSEVAARYPEVRCVRQENQGLSGARNTGLRESHGSYAVFLDADDRLLPEALAAGLECFETRPESAFVYGDYRYIAADGSVVNKGSKKRIVGNDHYLTLLQGNSIPMHATVMYTRDAVESVGGFGTFLACEDYDMYLRIARKFPIHHHEKVVAEYREHRANMSDNPALMLSNSVSVLRAQRKYAKEDDQYRKAYETGMNLWRGWYGDPLVDEVRARIREHHWKLAVRGVLVLLRYHPLGLPLLLGNERQMELRRLARGLLVQKQQLRVRQQRLEELEGTQDNSAAAQREVQRLRRRIRRTEQRMRALDQPPGHKRQTWISSRSVRRRRGGKKVVDLLPRIRHIVVRVHQIVKHYIRQFRRLVRRNLVRRVRHRVRRFRRSVEFVRLLGFIQAMRFLTRRLLGVHMIALKVPGVRTLLFCRTFGSDPWVLRGVFGAQHYEIALRDPPQLIIDGGANVGYAAVYFANKYPNAQIIAIEPDPENCALFHKNCASYPNVELIQGALWTTSADLVIENSTAESWAFRVVEAPSSTDRSFKGFTVADILRRSGKQQIDLLKLDVEGSEKQLFSSNYESWIGHVRNLVIEVHDHDCRDAVFTATNGHGFTISQSGAHIVIKKGASQNQPKQEESIR